jgi:hypothetical protein
VSPLRPALAAVVCSSVFFFCTTKLRRSDDHHEVLGLVGARVSRASARGDEGDVKPRPGLGLGPCLDAEQGLSESLLNIVVILFLFVNNCSNID